MDVRSKNIIGEYEKSLARVVLLCVSELPIPLGIEKVARLLKGCKSTFVIEKELQKLSVFSLLSCFSIGQLRQVLERLIEKGLLKLESASLYQNIPVLKLTEEGQDFLEGICNERPALSDIFIDRDIPELSQDEREMYQKLKTLRYGMAADRGIRPFMVCGDSILRELVMKKPANREQLLEVKGIGERFADNYGDEFLSLISKCLDPLEA